MSRKVVLDIPFLPTQKIEQIFWYKIIYLYIMCMSDWMKGDEIWTDLM
jgi:hypothetical protein